MCNTDAFGMRHMHPQLNSLIIVGVLALGTAGVAESAHAATVEQLTSTPSSIAAPPDATRSVADTAAPDSNSTESPATEPAAPSNTLAMGALAASALAIIVLVIFAAVRNRAVLKRRTRRVVRRTINKRSRGY